MLGKKYEYFFYPNVNYFDTQFVFAFQVQNGETTGIRRTAILNYGGAQLKAPLKPLSILNQMDSHLVQNRKENCHHDHIPFNFKGNRIIVFSV